MSQLVFSMCWNPKEVGSKVRENGCVSKARASRTREKVSFSYILPAEGMVQIKCVSSCLRSHIKGVCLLPQRTALEVDSSTSSKKLLTGVPSISELQFTPDAVKLTVDNHHHKHSLSCELSQGRAPLTHHQSDFIQALLDELISLLSLHTKHATLVYRVFYRSLGDPQSNHITEKSHSSTDGDVFIAA